MKKKKGFSVSVAEFKLSWKKNLPLYMFLVLPLIYFIVFKYAPMVGNVIAFRKYVPGKSYLGVQWVGWRYFKMFINDSGFWQAFRNTITISLLSLCICFPLPIIFSLLLNELTARKYKKFVQTVTIMPRFLSAVIVVAMMKSILSPTSGIINDIITKLGGESIYFMNSNAWFKPVYVLSEVWQFLGWNAIIYMAVLSSADQEQYEAARVDGASRLQQAWYVTLPVLKPTVAINLIIFIGNMLNVAFEKILLMLQPSLYESGDVIQTMVYRVGLINANYSFATAIGLFQGVISLVLLWGSNKLTNKVWDAGLF